MKPITDWTYKTTDIFTKTKKESVLILLLLTFVPNCADKEQIIILYLRFMLVIAPMHFKAPFVLLTDIITSSASNHIINKVY
jgi:hypothetical protein